MPRNMNTKNKLSEESNWEEKTGIIQNYSETHIFTFFEEDTLK